MLTPGALQVARRVAEVYSAGMPQAVELVRPDLICHMERKSNI